MTPFTDQRTTLQSLHSVTSQDTATDPETREHFGEAEKHFSFHSLEKILGLLASIIPKESSVSLQAHYPYPLMTLASYSCPVGAVHPECF